VRWRVSISDVYRLIRFYQAAAVNAAFGFGLYSLFVWLGANMYVAQIMAHCLGVAFNYFTYSRHVFNDMAGSPKSFVMAYGVNYLVGLAALAGLSSVIHSPYVAGFGALIVASLVNYIVLKRVVFVGTRP